ncbi:HET-C-related protein [Pseudomonas sp. UBA1879]|uniref:HET-C-related protein n=1 Tax=Pseudomonas sp. UBA1879 TaxID=1947305 RepID=UPI0025CFECBC|nr:HET-C-related protein [Pseudomonas sp. UBA1879]
MAFQLATPRFLDQPETAVRSTFALDLLTQVAATLSADDFAKQMARIFGQDIPESVYRALQDRLIAGEIDNPVILIEDGDYLADYSNREKVIRIHSEVIHNALENGQGADFLDVLLHEFGHHIDNVLRNDLTPDLDDGATPIANDASGEEGSRFSIAMATIGQFDTERVRIASYRHGSTSQPLGIEVQWTDARIRILWRYSNLNETSNLLHPHPERERFEAGDGDEHHHTHETIESVLYDLEMSPYELNTLYFGNWLRDYSQLLDPKIVRAASAPKDFPDVLSRDALTRIVDVLSLKRFGDIRQAGGDLYRVTPDVLGVYRPSEHIDNPRVVDRNTPDPKSRDQDFEPLVFDGDPLLQIDYATSMKRYIGRSVDFMARELRFAMEHPRKPWGLRAFGSALHVLEDFFAHSNFVELALIKNGHSEVLPWTSPAECEARLPLVTGMFGATDVLASVAGPMGKILFSLDDLTYRPIKPGDRSPREQMLLILLEEHENPSYLAHFQAFLNARDGWVGLPFAEFVQRSAAYLTGPASVLGNALGIVMQGVLTRFGENIKDWQTRYGEDPHDNGSTDPTHSQLAKDHAEHPLHLLASQLASEAVRAVGAAMVRHWNGDTRADPVAIATAYFKHPYNSEWQDAPVADWAAKNTENVRRATSKFELRAIHEQLADTGQATLDRLAKDGAAYLNFMRGEFQDKDSPLWVLLKLTPAGSALYALYQALGIIK